MNKKLTIKELASALEVSTVSIYKWKSLGMPCDSIEAAQIWRASVAKGAPGNRARLHKLRKAREAGLDIPDNSKKESSVAMPDEADTSIEAVVERARRCEWIAFQALQTANDAGIVEQYKLLTDNHSRAVKARLDAESASVEMQEKAGKIITLDDAMLKWGAMANSIRTLLDNLPKSVGARCNPADPELAIQALQDWVQNQALKALSK